MFGALRREVGEIPGKVCKMEEVTIIKGGDNARSCPDVSIPPKMSVSKVAGRIKGKRNVGPVEPMANHQRGWWFVN